MADGDVTIRITLDDKEVNAKITELTKKLQDMARSANGGGMVTEFREIATILRDVSREVSNVTSQMQAMRSSGTVNTSEYQQMQALLAGYADQLRIATARINAHNSATSRVGSTARKAGAHSTSAFKSVEKAIKNAFNVTKKFTSTIAGALSRAFDKVRGSAEKALSAKTFKKGLTTLLKYGFGVRSLYFAFRKLRAAIKEGLENLVKFEYAVGTSQNVESTNKAITSLNTSLLYLKNAWGAAIAPVINYVMPVLTALIDKLAQVGNAIARFVGALTGQQTVLNAVKVDAQDYAESLGVAEDNAKGASGATKKLTDRLAAFDDLNVLGKDDDTGGGAGGGADIDSYIPDPSEMFEYVDATSEFADMLKEAWEKADFSSVGEAIKDKIIGTLEGIDWDEVKANANKLGASIGSFLAGLFGDPELFKASGKTIGEAINTVTGAIKSFLEQTKGIDFGGNLAQGINEFLNTTDFQQAGANISEAFSQITTNINSFLDTLDSDAIGTAISDFISKLDIPKMMSEAGKTAVKLIATAIEITSDVIDKLSQDISDKLVLYVSSEDSITFTDENGDTITVPIKPEVDWTENPIKAAVDKWLIDVGETIIQVGFGITGVDETNKAFEDFNRVINSAITGMSWANVVISTLSGNFGGLMGSLKKLDEVGALDGLRKAFETAKETFDDTWGKDSDFGKGLQKIKDFFKEIGDSVKVTFEAFDMGVEGVGEIFVLGAEEVGGGIVTFMVDFVDACEDFGTKWKEFWALFEGFDIEDLLDGIGDGVAEDIITPIVDGFTTMKADLSVKWDEISADANEKWNNTKDNITLAFTTAKDFVDENAGLLYDNIKQTWEDIHSDSNTTWESVKNTIRDKVSALKSEVDEKVEEIKTNLAQKWQDIKGQAYEKFVGMKTNIVNVFEQLKEAVKSPINGFIGMIESMINKIITGINYLADRLNSLPDIQFSWGGQDYEIGFSLPTLSYVSLPRLAQGAVIPPNKEFMAVLGDQTSGTNIEAPLDTIKQAVAEEISAQMDVLTNGFASVVEAINNKNLVIGDKEIGMANNRYNNRQKIIRGTTF